MKIGRLDSLGETHQGKAAMFAHAGSSYWNVAWALNQKNDQFNLWDLMFVGTPAMHMALELMIKAIVSFSDDSYDPKSSRHRTGDLIHKYSANIEEFKIIQDDAEKIKLIKELEVAWLGLRYGECTFQYSSEDFSKFNDIMEILSDKFKKLSGLTTL